MTTFASGQLNSGAGVSTAWNYDGDTGLVTDKVYAGEYSAAWSYDWDEAKMRVDRSRQRPNGRIPE